MQKVAQSWLVLELTNSAWYLALDAFVGEAPLLLFTLIGGVIADRRDRRKLLLLSQIVQMSSAFSLAALVATGHVSIWAILCLSFISGTAQAFGGPAYQSLIPSLVSTGAPAERHRTELHPVQHRARPRPAARWHCAAPLRDGVVLHPERTLVPGRHRVAALVAHPARAAREDTAHVGRAAHGPRVCSRRIAARGPHRPGVCDDVSGDPAPDVSAAHGAERLSRRRRRIQPHDGVFGWRRDRRRRHRGLARTLQAHGIDRASGAGRGWRRDRAVFAIPRDVAQRAAAARRGRHARHVDVARHLTRAADRTERHAWQGDEHLHGRLQRRHAARQPAERQSG